VRRTLRAGGLRWALLLLALVAVMLTVVSSAAADQTFTDPSGDGQVGTDITSVAVKNDASGNITIDVTSVNPIVSNHAIAIFVDADRNPATGGNVGGLGVDYWFFGGPAVGVRFLAWNGSTFAATSPGSFSAGAAGTNTSEFRINKADLGNTSGFSFVAISISIDPPNVNFWDSAPDTGAYSYSLTVPPPPPTTTSTTPTPAPKPPATVGLGAVSVRTAGGVHAGRIFTVSARVTTTARTVRVRCVIKVSGRTVPSLGRYAAHVASCQGIAPPRTAGKRLAGTMTVTIAGDRDTRAFSFVIRT
jgi:hypothetical protein